MTYLVPWKSPASNGECHCAVPRSRSIWFFVAFERALETRMFNPWFHLAVQTARLALGFMRMMTASSPYSAYQPGKRVTGPGRVQVVQGDRCEKMTSRSEVMAPRRRLEAAGLCSGPKLSRLLCQLCPPLAHRGGPVASRGQ
jgi:hypothetical protein